MPDCPRCGLIHPPEAEVCDCGYALSLPASMQSPEMRRPISRYPAWKLLRNAGWALIALVALLLTFCLLYFSGTAMGFAFLLLYPGGGAAILAGCILLGVSSWLRARSG